MEQSNASAIEQPGTSATGQQSEKVITMDTTTKWKLGDNCRALYSGDGVMYEATISSLNQDKGTCHVTYLGYDNKEEVPLKILKPSSGEAARKAQGMVVPPPPPPHLIASSPDNDSEVLSAMLMSWYISGYHTGYYQGLKQGKSSVANSDSFGGNSSKKK
ncbi:Survival motor neuron protein [Blattella germanica]|nr:Survival motor neuron protein [Blattella germanica]